MKNRIAVAICVIMMMASVACFGKKPAESSGEPAAAPSGTEQEAAEGQQNAAEEPQNAAEEPQNAAEEPQNAAEEPQNAAEEPQNAAEEPQNAAEEPQNATEEPQNAAEESRSGNTQDEPEAAAGGSTASTAEAEKKEAEESADAAFSYDHDPRENPAAMADIIENPDAVYGFSPDPESTRLGSFAEYDWTDPEFVAKAQEDRRAYHESMESMTDILYEMRAEGASIEEMARAVSEERNRLRMASSEDDPEGLKSIKESNLKTYGHEEGPTPDQLYEKYGSWTTVMQKAFSPNMGMDACCGLYDEYYWLYIELGYVE